MEPLQHDPKTKQQIKDMLYGFIYTPVQKQFANRLAVIVTKNTTLLGARHNSFIYKGEVYSCDVTPTPRIMNKLVPLLIPVMNQYLADLKELNTKELPYVLGYINKVLNSSNDLCDYLRVLPQSLHAPIERYIATCPCRTNHLTDKDVLELITNNKEPINLIKQRLVTNLLI